MGEMRRCKTAVLEGGQMATPGKPEWVNAHLPAAADHHGKWDQLAQLSCLHAGPEVQTAGFSYLGDYNA